MVAKVLDLAAPALPGVWPLRGTCKKAMEFYYGSDDNFKFPPPGLMLEVSYIGEVRDCDVGTWTRDSLDSIYFGWLMKLQSIMKDPENVEAFRRAGEQVTMSFKAQVNETDRIAAVYQLFENEEKNADLLGHSLLRRARELASIQDCIPGVGPTLTANPKNLIGPTA